MMLGSKLPLALLVLSIMLFSMMENVSETHGQGSALISVNPDNISDFSKTPGTTVAFSVAIADSPAISGFRIVLSYNSSVLTATSIDFSNTVLGSNTIVAAECVGFSLIVDGCVVDSNRIELVLTILGPGTTTPPTNGLLFTVNFNVTGEGLSELHFLTSILGNAGAAVPVSASDGYFTNIDCPRGSNLFCTPPMANFSISPSKLFTGNPATFNATSSLATNAGATIRSYLWVWVAGNPVGTGSDSLETLNPIVSHSFQLSGNFTATLSVTDSFGTTASKTVTFSVVQHPDFTVQVPPGVSFDGVLIVGRSIYGAVQIASVADFVGEVNLTVDVPSYAGYPPSLNVTASLNLRSIEVSGGGKYSIQLLISAAEDSVAGFVTVVITGTSFSQVHSLYLDVYVVRPSVILSCDPWFGVKCGPFLVPPGGDVSFQLFLRSIFGFTGTIRLPTASYQGATITFSQPEVLMSTPNETRSVTALLSTTAKIQPGGHGIGIDVISTDGEVYDTTLSFYSENPPFLPDFGIDAPPLISIRAGQNATILTSLSSLNGYTGRVEVVSGPVPIFPSNGLLAFNGTYVVLGNDQTISVKETVSASLLMEPGNYTIAVGAYGTIGLPDCPQCSVGRFFATTVRVLPPADPPIFVQFHWTHVLSHSDPAGILSQHFTIGIFNPNNSTVLYVDIRITGVSQTDGAAFQIESGTLRLFPGHTITNIRLTQTIPSSETGAVFVFNTTIHWGISENALNMTDSISNVTISGNFRVR